MKLALAGTLTLLLSCTTLLAQGQSQDLERRLGELQQRVVAMSQQREAETVILLKVNAAAKDLRDFQQSVAILKAMEKLEEAEHILAEHEELRPRFAVHVMRAKTILEDYQLNASMKKSDEVVEQLHHEVVHPLLRVVLSGVADLKRSADAADRLAQLLHEQISMLATRAAAATSDTVD